MAKRRMRRTSTPTQNARNTGSLTEGFVDQARRASVGMVNVATEVAKAALGGMQQVGRTMAEMAAPTARRTMAAAADTGRAAVEGAGDVSRAMSNAMADAAENTRESASSAGRAARRATSPKPRTRKRSSRRAA
jgi:hypothetical protein